MHDVRETARAVGRSGAVLLLFLIVVAGLLPGPAVAGSLPPPIPAATAVAVPSAGTTTGTAPASYDVPSLSFWRAELPWDSSKLQDTFLTLIGPPTRYKGQVGTENHLLAAWKEYRRKNGVRRWAELPDERKRDLWETYLNRYIGIQDNLAQGREFEALYARTFRLAEAGYRLDAPFPGSRRRGDAFVPGPGGYLLELKSGSSPIDRDQARFLAGQAKAMGKTLVYVFGATPQQKDLDYLAKLDRELNGGRPGLIMTRSFPANGRPVRHPNAPPAPTGSRSAGGSGSGTAGGSGGSSPLVAAGQVGAADTPAELVTSAPASPEEAAADAWLADQLAQEAGYQDAADAGVGPAPLGGVDFSTLELRYLADTYDGGVGAGVRYAFQVEPAPGQAVSFGGRQSARLASDAFFTWLALRPSSFTVNLNPNEPYRIVEQRLGTTDAGRVLLEADFRMKKTVAALIHPDTARGKDFWDALRGETKCLSMRQWIVPARALVRERGNELFIVDARLQVKMETEYLAAGSARDSSSCAGQPSADTRYNESVFRARILPQVQRAVNEAPEYAELRRVYVSRVAAQWYRDRSRTKPTAYRALIDSGDVRAWRTRTSWTPRQTFDAYVKSYENGEFRVTRRVRSGDYLISHLYIYGGVDLTEVPTWKVSDRLLATTRPGLDAAVGGSLSGPVTEPGTRQVWLGGRSTQRPLSEAIPEPGSPMGGAPFWLLSGLPVLAWWGAGVVWLLRRRGHGRGRPSPALPGGNGVTP